jgi:putative peptide zinc metalloprotease protein
VAALPWPGGCRAPAIVEYSPLERIRASSPGFVENVCVSSGQRVDQGHVLVQLSNPDLLLELKELELALAKSRLESRGHQQNQQMAAYQAELKDQEGLEKRWREKRAQVDELTIRAPIPGTVLSRELARLEGSFVPPGTQVASVCNLARKELRISIDQDDVDRFHQRVDQDLRVRMRGLRTFRARLCRISPQASLEPLHPSLCASAGGSLPVRAKVPGPSDSLHAQQAMELIAPRFEGTVRLSPEQSSQLRAGQRGMVSFTSGQQTVGRHLYRAVSSWMAQKLGRSAGA